MRTCFILLLNLLCLVPLKAQQDSATTFSTEDLYRLVLSNHPVAKQALLLTESAKAELRIAKGMLDPKLQASYNGKTLAGTDYFRMWDMSLAVPVWWGTDLKIGYENNTGINVNPETQTPQNGLIYAGITVPLGQGMIIDERRNTIRQAQLLPAMAEAEKIKTINKLLFEATKDYWDWYYAFERNALFEEAFRLAEDRFTAVKLRYIQGDAPAIDTLEALIAVQERDLLRQQARADLKNAALKLSLHLWNSEGQPVELGEKISPANDIPASAIGSDSLLALSNAARKNHPDLVKLELKNEQLTIENKYQRDQLKPKASLRYNVLTKKASDFQNADQSDFYTNNYKLGFSFTYPILLRKERGKIRQTELKIEQTRLDRSFREREIQTEIEMAGMNWNALAAQISLQESQVQNAKLLRDAELSRFENGESSVFLVNAREQALINSKVRLAELQAKFQKNKAQLYWAAGMLPQR